MKSVIWLLCLVSIAKGGITFPDEKYFSNIRQLTFGGHHSLPSFNYDGSQIVFSAKGGPYGMNCDQIYRIDLNNLDAKPARLSPGLGYATNARFFPGTNDVTFESNFHKINYPDNFVASNTCPLRTCDTSHNSTVQQLCNTPTWDFYSDTDIFLFNQYANIKEQYSASNPGEYYGGAWVAKPTFDGQMLYYFYKDDLGINLYVRPIMQTTDPTLVTEQNVSYFGGISIDTDERRAALHGYHPTTLDNQKILKTYLSYNLIPTSTMDIFFVSFDGYDLQVVKSVHGYSNSYPVFANTKGNKIVFSTNYNQINNNFGLYLYNIFDESLKPVSTLTGNVSTIHAAISSDFNKIVFASNRNSSNPSEFQLFLADFNVTGSSSGLFDGGHFNQEKHSQSLKVEEQDTTCWQNTPTDNYYDGIVHFPGEVHLKNVKQLTFGGENAEGYFSFDDNMLTIQATGLKNYGTGCDQIYQIDLCKDPTTQIARKMSTGLGVCTCSFFYPDGKQSLYAGTFRSVKVNSSIAHDVTCPIKTCSSNNPALSTNTTLAQLCNNASYTWDIYPDFDIYLVNEYGIITKQLTNTPGYDAEGVISPDGKMIAFTSMRNGDLDIYIMDLDGGNVRQITNVTGYDGGAFFSPDSKRLIFRASRPKPGQETDYYKLLLKYNIVVPLAMELFVVNVDGSNMKQITKLGGANWAPYYLKDNKRIIFSSDFNDTAGFGAFSLYVINDDGTGLERVTWDDGQFDAFPMMNHAGTKLVWGSSRNSSTYDVNLFVADWVDPQPSSNTTTSPSSTTTTSPPNNTGSPASRSVPLLIPLLLMFCLFF